MRAEKVNKNIKERRDEYESRLQELDAEGHRRDRIYMAKQVRYFRQVIPHLENKYGKGKAETIMAKALKRYDELLE
ncbi:MAG: hypothetical protein K6A71_11500, partial [Lachnospiraceae bacterium]|nr:hypothetical protein [Lachnospiraceae bacterium]